MMVSFVTEEIHLSRCGSFLEVRVVARRVKARSVEIQIAVDGVAEKIFDKFLKGSGEFAFGVGFALVPGRLCGRDAARRVTRIQVHYFAHNNLATASS